MAAAARDFGVSALKGEPGFQMVEFEDSVLLRSVTISAVFLGKLVPMGPIGLMAPRAATCPPGYLEAPVIEAAHGKDGRSMAKVTPGFREDSFMGVFGPVTNRA